MHGLHTRTHSGHTAHNCASESLGIGGGLPGFMSSSCVTLSEDLDLSKLPLHVQQLCMHPGVAVRASECNPKKLHRVRDCYRFVVLSSLRLLHAPPVEKQTCRASE